MCAEDTLAPVLGVEVQRTRFQKIRQGNHAEQWDSVQIDGSFNDRDCAVSYSKSGRVLAVATVYRDRHSLEVEAWMERE